MSFLVSDEQYAILKLLAESKVQTLELLRTIDKGLDEFSEAVTTSFPEDLKQANASGLTIEVSSHSVQWKGIDVPRLTTTELGILDTLSKSSGRVVTRDELLARIWDSSSICARNVDSYVMRIRKKFRAIDPQFGQIETIYGVGYKWLS